MVWNFFKKKVAVVPNTEQSEPVAVVPNTEQSEPVAVVPKKKPTRPKKTRKSKPKAIEPKVDIIKFDFDPANPRIGSIELDWNTEFVELLTKHGYQGATPEDIVDAWLNDVCKTIVSNQFAGATVSDTVLNANLVNRKNLGAGKTEVS